MNNLILDVKDEIALLKISRPASLNALNSYVDTLSTSGTALSEKLNTTGNTTSAEEHKDI